MLIRSQDKFFLGEAKRISVRGNDVVNIILKVGSVEDLDVLGTYETTQRALEVVDCIENHIYEVEYSKSISNGNVLSPVFQMPAK